MLRLVQGGWNYGCPQRRAESRDCTGSLGSFMHSLDKRLQEAVYVTVLYIYSR